MYKSKRQAQYLRDVNTLDSSRYPYGSEDGLQTNKQCAYPRPHAQLNRGPHTAKVSGVDQDPRDC